VMATTLGWLVLGQSLTWVQTLGFGLALIAIAAAQLPSGVVRRTGGLPERDGRHHGGHPVDARRGQGCHL
jgi:hypothetical protein